jgi:hypothetical protein
VAALLLLGVAAALARAPVSPRAREALLTGLVVAALLSRFRTRH